MKAPASCQPGGQILYEPHACRLWHPDRAGIIYRCECGRLWRSVYPGHPAYAGWRRIGPLYRLVFRARLRDPGTAVP